MLFHSILPERMFSEENQAVAVKRESQLLFRLHVLFAVFQRFSTTSVQPNDSAMSPTTCP